MAHGNLVGSLLKGLDILNIVSSSESGLRLSEITKTLGEKKSTTYNLVRTLNSRGFLEKTTDGRHIIGSAVTALQANQKKREIMKTSAEVLRNLTAEISDAYPTFTELSGAEISVRLRMSPDRPGLLQKPKGIVFMPYSTASGLCHLAFISEEQRIQLMDNFPFDEFGSSHWESVEKLENYLREIRKTGYCSLKTKDPGAVRLGVPVFDNDERMVACLGLRNELKSDDMKTERREIIRTVLEAAAKI